MAMLEGIFVIMTAIGLVVLAGAGAGGTGAGFALARRGAFGTSGAQSGAQPGDRVLTNVLIGVGGTIVVVAFGSVFVAVVVIVALTMLGQSISAKFEKIEQETHQEGAP